MEFNVRFKSTEVIRMLRRLLESAERMFKIKHEKDVRKAYEDGLSITIYEGCPSAKIQSKEYYKHNHKKKNNGIN